MTADMPLDFFFETENETNLLWAIGKVENGGGEIFAGKTLGKILKLEGYLSSVF